MIIDQINGRWWIRGGEHCQPESCDAHPLQTQSACQDLGVVVLDRFGSSLLVQWDVDGVDPRSVETASAYLDGGHDLRRFQLRFFKYGWCTETYWSSRSAVARLHQVSGYKNVNGLSETVIEEKDLSRVETSEPLIQAAFSAWRQRDFPSLVHTLGLQKSAIILGKRGAYDELRYLFFGQGSEFFETYGAECANAMIGEGPDLVSDQSACENRLSLAYESCLESGVPMYQHTRARIQFDDYVDWKSFQRIVIPFKANAENWLVYSFAKFTPEVDIPFLGRFSHQA